MNIALLLDMAADACGERVAVGRSSDGVTFVALREQAHRVAGALRAVGAQRLVLAAENSELGPALLFGAAVAGVPFGAVNYRLADDRLRAVVARSAPAVVAVDARTRPRLTGLDAITLVDADELLASAPDDGSARDETGDSVAIALFTSGTTGDSKSVLLRHRNLFTYIVSTVELGAADPDDAALVSVPTYHIAGLAAVLSNAYLGRRIVYLPQFEPQAWVDAAAGERISHAMIVPTMLGRILDVLETDRVELPALRHLSYGGGRMPLSTIERAMALLPHVDFVNAYGLTETSSTISLLDPDDHRTAAGSDDPHVAARLGSVGRPLPGVEIEIRDDDGRPAPAGVTGAVWVRGDQVAGEYQGRSALDAAGWFPTNDLGRQDDGGYLYLEGRADDVIVRGGENLSPGEIEDVLLTHPAVAEVAVLGVPDTEWGEVPAAVVVAVAGVHVDELELQQWVRDRLRSSRTPARIVVRDVLPYSETGKLLRRVLRSELTPRGLTTVSAPSSRRPRRGSGR